MKFVPLFGLRVRHDYHGAATCRDLACEPTPETLRLIERYRLRIREIPGGLTVLAALAADGQTPLVGLPRDEIFAFHLRVCNTDFALFTDLQELSGKTDPVFSNAALSGSDRRTLDLTERQSWNMESFVATQGDTKRQFSLAGNPLSLDGDPLKPAQAADFSLVSPAGTAQITVYDAATKVLTLQLGAAQPDLTVRYRVRPNRDRRFLADVELRYDQSMPAPGASDASFEIPFKVRTGRWAYYLITNQKGDFSIVDTSAASPSISFSAANRTTLNDLPDDPDPDPLASLLSRQYPDLQRVRFLSDEAVPCSLATRNGIELRLSNQTLLRPLPNPALQHLSRIRQKAGAGFKEQDIFHQVVKYLPTH
ncbi:MAG: hypothetical protein DVS81_02290 [Candidatus Accumulibacter meliphilus]|jgi:hypothetical protein|uniref:Uncharacterized protein n=1 Tax=Candidatus Accumulibacter meliphilus TaxID=2211374 RepID=A0A369XTK5_9PROT|nr:MAG: hypothetical protein DVS81_02290 [Candidatus Accumulibacter meliphilus]